MATIKIRIRKIESFPSWINKCAYLSQHVSHRGAETAVIHRFTSAPHIYWLYRCKSGKNNSHNVEPLSQNLRRQVRAIEGHLENWTLSRPLRKLFTFPQFEFMCSFKSTADVYSSVMKIWLKHFQLPEAQQEWNTYVFPHLQKNSLYWSTIQNIIDKKSDLRHVCQTCFSVSPVNNTHYSVITV